MLDLDRGWERPSPTPEQQRIDVWIGLGAALVSIASLEVWRSAYNVPINGPDWIAFTVFAVAGLALAVRRRLPLPVLLAEATIFIAMGQRQPELVVVFTMQMLLFASLYAAWAWSRRTSALYATTVVVLIAMFGWLVWQFVHDMPDDPPVHEGLMSPYWAMVVYSLAINLIYFGGAIAWGHVAWRGARQRLELSQQYERERATQRRERERAVQAERVRIARDLHDVVAHHVSGIGVQAAGASRSIDNRPEVARAALETIEESSRTAVSQMHQLVGLLRDDADDRELAPQPGLADLHAIATSDQRPAIAFQQVGEPFAVPATVQLSLYRVTQEAVANIVRHAHGAYQGSVTLRYLAGEPDAVEVEVIDDGRGADDRCDDGGFGLTGIRERAAMHGGSCEIGPRPTGGFRVRVRIPVD